MKKSIKTSEVLAAYNILNAAKYGSMEDADKIKVWKITRALKPIATKFDEDSKDAAEKFKPKDKDFDEKLQKAQEYERITRNPKGDASKLPMGAAEYDAFIEKFKAYNKLVEEAVKEFANKEIEVNIDAISDETFGKLMSSNEWTMGQAVALSEIIVADEVNEKKKK
jgi:ClpP class serine protease